VNMWIRDDKMWPSASGIPPSHVQNLDPRIILGPCPEDIASVFEYSLSQPITLVIICYCQERLLSILPAMGTSTGSFDRLLAHTMVASPAVRDVVIVYRDP
jgi:hypothetical protein